MADRAEQNADLEDVLSSIRRLVSQNASLAEAPALVLTEAERVEDDDVLRPAPQPAAPHPMAHGTPANMAQPTPESAEPEGLVLPDAPAMDDAAFESHEADLVEEKLSQVDETPSELDASGMPDPSLYMPPHQPRAQAETATAAAIDMDDLRNIVTDIVREELRGPLGQKITRNVRKLVRQEIQRAMNAKALD